jgi:hypothetical protein
MIIRNDTYVAWRVFIIGILYITLPIAFGLGITDRLLQNITLSVIIVMLCLIGVGVSFYRAYLKFQDTCMEMRPSEHINKEYIYKITDKGEFLTKRHLLFIPVWVQVDRPYGVKTMEAFMDWKLREHEKYREEQQERTTKQAVFTI